MSFCKQVIVFTLCIFILLLGEAFGAKLYDITLTSGEVLTGWHLYKSQDDPNIFVAKQGSTRRELRRNQIKRFTKSSVVPDSSVSSGDTAQRVPAPAAKRQQGGMSSAEIRAYCDEMTERYVGDYHYTHKTSFNHSCRNIIGESGDRDVFIRLAPLIEGMFLEYEDCKKTYNSDICREKLNKARRTFNEEHGVRL